MSTAAPTAKRRTRDTWTSQTGFLLAAIGSAIGLGNIWRFPGVAYTNGGGAFLVPYLVALLFAGIPILWLEYAVGQWQWRFCFDGLWAVFIGLSHAVGRGL